MTKLIALLLLATTAACGELSYAPSSGPGDHRSNDPSSPSAPSEPSPIQNAPISQVNQQDPQPSSAASACPGAADCERLVFLSSATFSASYFHSALAADAKCNELAKASTDPEIQKRTFAAWMSDGTTSPKARFVRGEAKYTLPNGDKVADDFGDLTSDSGIYHSIQIDENGDHHSSGAAWTGTHPDGTATSADCSSWQHTTGQGTRGDITSDGSEWSAAAVSGGTSDTLGGGSGSSWSSCQAESAHIYCFEQ